MNPRTSRWRILLPVLGLLAGCSTVRPWERDHLASYGMRSDRDRLAVALNEHLWFSREAIHGGRTVGTAGCGCN